MNHTPNILLHIQTQENSTEQEEAIMKSQEGIPLLQEPSQVNIGRRYSEGDINPSSSPVKHKPPPAPHSQRASPNLEKGRHQQAATSPRSRRDLSPPRKAGAKKRDPSPSAGAGKRASSPTPSTESESSSISESMKHATPTEPPPFAVGERVRACDKWNCGFKLAILDAITFVDNSRQMSVHQKKAFSGTLSAIGLILQKLHKSCTFLDMRKINIGVLVE